MIEKEIFLQVSSKEEFETWLRLFPEIDKICKKLKIEVCSRELSPPNFSCKVRAHIPSENVFLDVFQKIDRLLNSHGIKERIIKSKTLIPEKVCEKLYLFDESISDI